MNQIVVIGGVPAGIEAAKTAAALGARGTLVNAGSLGGQTGWHSLVPSKVWLAYAPVALAIQLGGSLIDLAESSPAYPTASEISVLAARSLPA